jgi:hypothetical protein
MNASLNLTRNSFFQILRNDLFSNWLIQISGPRFTYEDYIGDPADEYAEYAAASAASDPASSNQPASESAQIAADEFETDYSWFLS